MEDKSKMKKPIKIKLTDMVLEEVANKVADTLINDGWDGDDVMHVKIVLKENIIDAVIDVLVEVE